VERNNRQNGEDSVEPNDYYASVTRTLLVEDNPPFLQRKYAEQIIEQFRTQAAVASPQSDQLQSIADGLARYAPAAAKVLATLIPSVVDTAAG